MDKVTESNNSIAAIEQVFADNPRQGHERLLSWKAADHANFLRQSIELLERAGNNSFTQLVQRLCREDSSKLKQTLFTADLLSLDESARLLRISSKSDARYETHLISELKAEVDRPSGGIANKDFERLLEILAQAIAPERLGGILARFYDHPDGRLRSKAALLSGRLGRQFLGKYLPKQTELLKDLDPRVRSNAVESLWGRRDAESLDLLREASRDESPRVASNGLYGLYLAGDISCVCGILKMARDGDVGRQLSGIWLIGRTADFRFSQVVQTDLAVRIGRVKFALLQAGRKIKKRRQELLLKPPLQVELVRFERAENGRLSIGLLVADSEGRFLCTDELVSTQVLLHDGELRVDQFSFEANGKAVPLHAVLLIPLGTDIGDGIALEDQWAIQKYLPHQGREAEGAASGLEEAVEKLLCAFPNDATEKHMVLVVDPELDSAFRVPEHWEELFERLGVSAQVLTCKELDPAGLASWRQFCLARKGLLMECKNVFELGAALRKVNGLLHSGFSLTYQLSRMLPQAGGPEGLSIDLTTPLGCGRLVLNGAGEVVAEVALTDKLEL